jgi:hypothetical protein
MAEPPLVGGLGKEIPANEEVRKIVSSVAEPVGRMYSAGVSAIEPIGFKTQVVAGLNYFVRVGWFERKSGTRLPSVCRLKDKRTKG